MNILEALQLMNEATQEPDLRYPVGKFDREDTTPRAEQNRTIAELPAKLKAAVDGLNDEQLDTPYRPDG